MHPDSKIATFLKKHHVLTLATVSGGQPWVANCFYAFLEEEMAFVFTSGYETRHIQEVLLNHKVAGNVVLETGINGFVAGSILAHARKKWEVHGVDITETAGLPSDIRAHQLDLTNPVKLAELFDQIRPDAVIHTAAIANIDVCENKQDLAWKVNVEITKSLAELCQKNGTKMIVCSTDTVFDGIKGDYLESDSPNGVNFYAKTKIEAEKIVLGASSKNIVARLAQLWKP